MLQARHDRPRSHGIDVSERSATKRRKAQTKYRADIAVARRADDPLAEAARRFVHHLQRHTLTYLVTRNARAAARLATEQVVDRVIDVLFLALLVEIESASVFAAVPAI